MRTTLTLDDDVEAALREAIRRSGESLKQVVGAAVGGNERISLAWAVLPGLVRLSTRWA